MDQQEFFVRCASGFESLLADELKSIKIKRVRPLKGGVAFFGTLEQAYRVCLWSRVASRVLLVIDRIDANTAETLYESVKNIAWEDHFDADGSIAVHAKGSNANLRNTQFIAVKAKDAICDRLRERTGKRPNVAQIRPDVLIDISVRDSRGTVSLDLSGEPLHRRAYRKEGVQSEAPLKENLAAALLLASGWNGVNAKDRAFCDPMCGSGTIAIEAAMIAGDIAPGILRDYWGFLGWKQYDDELWGDLIAEADDRCEKKANDIPFMLASDHDESCIQLTRENARRAGVAEYLQFEVCDASEACSKLGEVHEGLLATNPPYGERLGTKDDLSGVYSALSKAIGRLSDGWQVSIITPDESIDLSLKLVPFEKVPLYNGKIETFVRRYQIDSSQKNIVTVIPLHETHEVTVEVLEPNTQQFVDRLRKVAKEREKWAKRNAISCYRVYDADLPDYSLAIDVYQGKGAFEGQCYVHIAEYKAPKIIDEGKAQRRFADAVSIVPAVLNVPEKHVFTKVRKQEVGGSQYRAQERKPFVAFTDEDGYLIEIDLNGYLDTGIFLDHRDTRREIEKRSSGKRFLNLFAYTGVATVHAAAGGAVATTTVDLSHTYIEWAKRNMKRNGFDQECHHYVKADVLTWIDEAINAHQEFDFIFVDPPTFSNSKSMGEETWSVQRDHAALLRKVAQLLSSNGELVFSCNLRSFKIDVDSLSEAGLTVSDVSTETIPEDFKRNSKIHKCYRITK